MNSHALLLRVRAAVYVTAECDSLMLYRSSKRRVGPDGLADWSVADEIFKGVLPSVESAIVFRLYEARLIRRDVVLGVGRVPAVNLFPGTALVSLYQGAEPGLDALTLCEIELDVLPQQQSAPVEPLDEGASSDETAARRASADVLDDGTEADHEAAHRQREFARQQASAGAVALFSGLVGDLPGEVRLAIEAVFNALDRRGRGKLAEKDLVGYFSQGMGLGATEARARAQRCLTLFDPDGRGSVSLAAWLSVFASRSRGAVLSAASIDFALAELTTMFPRSVLDRWAAA